MKSLINVLALSLLIVLSNSCKKEAATSASSKSAENSASLIGSWELRQIFAQVGTITYPSGNGKIIKFDGSNYSTTDSTYKIFVQGNQPKQGHYEIVADTSVNTSIGLAVTSGQFMNRMILNNDTISDKVFYEITNSKLVILSGFFPTDGGVEMTYERQ